MTQSAPPQPMAQRARKSVGAFKGRAVRSLGAAEAWRRRRRSNPVEPGVTVVTVNWNSLPYLQVMIAAVRALSPADTKILVVDNASTDGSREWLSGRDDVEVLELPVNVGHGIGLDLGACRVRTEFLAVLDIDAFPVSDIWLTASLEALQRGTQVAGAHMHRNFVHPCFLVMRTSVLREYDLTFRPVGSLTHLGPKAPLFLDVAEGLCQRLIVRFCGSQALHLFPITSLRGPGMAGAVFGDLVYHNMFATQGAGKEKALEFWREAVQEHLPSLRVD